MAKQISTNGYLASLLQDIENIKQGSPALELFNRTRIARFKEENKERIENLNDHVHALGELFVKKDTEGRQIIKTVNNRQQLDFIDKESEAEYLKHYKELMAKNIDIIV